MGTSHSRAAAGIGADERLGPGLVQYKYIEETEVPAHAPVHTEHVAPVEYKIVEGNGSPQPVIDATGPQFQWTGQYQWDQQGPHLISIACVCGYFFTDDSAYCRHCGAPRSQAEALAALARDKALLNDAAAVSGPAVQKAEEDAARAKEMADRADALAREAQEAGRLSGMAPQLTAKAQAAADNAKQKEMLALQLREELKKAREWADREALEAARIAKEREAAVKLRLKLCGGDPNREADILAKANELGPRAMQLTEAARQAAADADRARDLALEKARAANDLGSQFAGVRDRAAQAKAQVHAMVECQGEEAQAKQLGDQAHHARAEAAQLRVQADQLAATAAMALRQAQYAEQMARESEELALKSEGRARDLTDHAHRFSLKIKVPEIPHSAALEDARGLAAQANQLGPAADQAAADALQAQSDAAARAARAKELALEAEKAQEKARPWLVKAKEINAQDVLLAKESQASSFAQEAMHRVAQLANDAAQADQDAANARLQAKPLMDEARGLEERLRGIHLSMPDMSGMWPGGMGGPDAKHAANLAQKAKDDAANARAQALAAADHAKKMKDMLEAKQREQEQLCPTVCQCGSVFLQDAIFCRKCGRPRNQTFAWDSLSPHEVPGVMVQPTPVPVQCAPAHTQREPIVAPAQTSQPPRTAHVHVPLRHLSTPAPNTMQHSPTPVAVQTMQPGQYQAMPPVEPVASTLFDQMDLNHDGVVTKAEFQATMGQMPPASMGQMPPGSMGQMPPGSMGQMPPATITTLVRPVARDARAAG